jgi:hypothetical protein
MLDNEASHALEGKETEEQNLEDLRRKYPWCLNKQGNSEATALAGKANAEDTVILFKGKDPCVKREEDDIIKGSVSDGTADVDVDYVNIVT